MLAHSGISVETFAALSLVSVSVSEPVVSRPRYDTSLW